jgi:glycosyltransferase involved in cell wall biosynthesis
MADGETKESTSLRVLILAGRLGLDDDGWSLLPLIERLELRGVSVQVLCLDRNQEPETLGRIIEKPTLRHPWLRWLSLRRLPGDAALHRPDLIHVVHDEMMEVALSLSEQWQVPYVASIDDYGVVDRGLRISGRWCRALIATSPELAQTLQNELKVPPGLIETILPGILVQELPGHGLESDRIPVIGSAGPSVESSGFQIFFEAVRTVLADDQDAEFIVALQGDDMLDIRRLAQWMGIGDRITIADFALLGPRFWTVLDIYCQPALSPNAGRTLALAMANEVPSVVTDVAGLHSLIHDGQTGLIVPGGDPTSLAQAILMLLKDREAAGRLARSASEFILERFDSETEANQLLDLYRKIVSIDSRPISPT